eukprot:Gb_29108 [translate_table: standard]
MALIAQSLALYPGESPNFSDQLATMLYRSNRRLHTPRQATFPTPSKLTHSLSLHRSATWQPELRGLHRLWPQWLLPSPTGGLGQLWLPPNSALDTSIAAAALLRSGLSMPTVTLLCHCALNSLILPIGDRYRQSRWPTVVDFSTSTNEVPRRLSVIQLITNKVSLHPGRSSVQSPRLTDVRRPLDCCAIFPYIRWSLNHINNSSPILEFKSFGFSPSHDLFRLVTRTDARIPPAGESPNFSDQLATMLYRSDRRLHTPRQATFPTPGKLTHSLSLHRSATWQRNGAFNRLSHQQRVQLLDTIQNLLFPWLLIELQGLQRLWPQRLLLSPTGGLGKLEYATAFWHQCLATALPQARLLLRLL